MLTSVGLPGLDGSHKAVDLTGRYKAVGQIFGGFYTPTRYFDGINPPRLAGSSFGGWDPPSRALPAR